MRVAKMRRAEGEGEGKGEGVFVAPSNAKLRKGLWSLEEDNKLMNYIMKNGFNGCWSYIAKQAGLQRCGKSCRLRWINYLRPGIKRGPFSPQEDQLITQLQSTLGNRWSRIAAHLPGRTDNEIKNYRNSCIKKKELRGHHLSSLPSSSSITNIESNILSQSDLICNTNSVSAHAHVAAQPYLDQPPNNTFLSVVTTEENQSYVPDFLELADEQVLNQDHEFFIDRDPTNFQPWIDSAAHTHPPVSADHSLGSTDNEIKNHWNSCIKKKEMRGHRLSSSSTTNNESNVLSQSDLIRNTYSVFSHAQDAAQPYLDQPPNNTFTGVVATGENQLYDVPDFLELTDEQVLKNQDHEFSIDQDPTNFQPWIDSAAHTHPPVSADQSLGHTSVKIPNIVEGEWWKEQFGNDGLNINDNEIIFDYSSSPASSVISSAWRSSHSYSNAAEYCTPVVNPEAQGELLGISSMEVDNYVSLHSFSPVNFSQFIGQQADNCSNPYPTILRV